MRLDLNALRPEQTPLSKSSTVRLLAISSSKQRLVFECDSEIFELDLDQQGVQSRGPLVTEDSEAHGVFQGTVIAAEFLIDNTMVVLGELDMGDAWPGFVEFMRADQPPSASLLFDAMDVRIDQPDQHGAHGLVVAEDRSRFGFFVENNFRWYVVRDGALQMTAAWAGPTMASAVALDPTATLLGIRTDSEFVVVDVQSGNVLARLPLIVVERDRRVRTHLVRWGSNGAIAILDRVRGGTRVHTVRWRGGTLHVEHVRMRRGRIANPSQVRDQIVWQRLVPSSSPRALTDLKLQPIDGSGPTRLRRLSARAQRTLDEMLTARSDVLGWLDARSALLVSQDGSAAVRAVGHQLLVTRSRTLRVDVSA